MKKIDAPQDLKESEVPIFKQELVAAINSSEELILNLDSIKEIDLGGFNSIVSTFYEALESGDKFYLSLKDNSMVMSFFELSKLDFILNTYSS